MTAVDLERMFDRATGQRPVTRIYADEGDAAPDEHVWPPDMSADLLRSLAWLSTCLTYATVSAVYTEPAPERYQLEQMVRSGSGSLKRAADVRIVFAGHGAMLTWDLDEAEQLQKEPGGFSMHAARAVLLWLSEVSEPMAKAAE